jgi:hypothetical protein
MAEDVEMKTVLSSLAGLATRKQLFPSGKALGYFRIDSSPAFQRWVLRFESGRVPAGTKEAQSFSAWRIVRLALLKAHPYGNQDRNQN